MAERPAERTRRTEMLLEPSAVFAVVPLNSTCRVGFPAHLMIVMKAGRLRTECGSLAVLHHHHKLCGPGDKEELLWKV